MTGKSLRRHASASASASASAPVSKRYKSLTDAEIQDDESILPLLPKAMADDKVSPGSPDLHLSRSDTGGGSQNSIQEYEKAPWWSYVWVSLVNLLLHLQTPNIISGL